MWSVALVSAGADCVRGLEPNEAERDGSEQKLQTFTTAQKNKLSYDG